MTDTSGQHFTSRNPSKAKKAGRVCEERGCVTVLSIYNTGKLCSVHEDFQVPRTRGRNR